MKIINITYSIIFAGLVFLATACSDVVTYNDGYDDQLASYGPPSVNRITTAKDTATTITESSLAEMITLHGNNLTDITSIFINDVEVDLSTIYAVRTRLTLPVPRILPMEADNKIKVTTKLGTVSVPLTVNVPPLTLSGLDNEYAAVGDTVNVNGANFDLYEIVDGKGKVYFGDIEAKIDTTTAEYVAVIVPQGATQGDRIHVVGPLADMYAPGRYMDNRGLFQDIDHYQGWTGQNWFTDGSRPVQT